MFCCASKLFIVVSVAQLSLRVAAVRISRSLSSTNESGNISHVRLRGHSLNMFEGKGVPSSAERAKERAERLAKAVEKMADDVYGRESEPPPPRQVSNSSAESMQEADADPRMFFLFMTIDGIGHRDLWESFVSETDKRRWRVLLHCAQHVTCQASAAQRKFEDPLGVTLVETVASTYCKDLVSPMVQLLRYAVSESMHPGDKFMFISDSTVPVKPFHFIYQTLTANRESDMCIEPRSRWLQLDAKGGQGAAVVKHSQWVVLNKQHAHLMVSRWPHVHKDASWSVPVWPQSNSPTYDHTDFSKVPQNSLCADEWAIFATIFGVISGQPSTAHMEGLSAPALDFSGGSAAYVGQGTCRTFVTWGAGMVQNCPDLVQRVKYSLDCYPTCSGSHPASFAHITDDALSALRDSSFLFARKFPSAVLSLDKFQRFFLAKH